MKPRVLLSISCRGWAFHNIALQVSKRLSDKYDFRLLTLAETEGGLQPDLAVSFYWPESERLRARLAPCTRHIPCLYDHLSWQPSSRAGEGRNFFLRVLKNAKLLLVGSPLLAAAVREVGPPCPFTICPDGVDLELFKPLPFPDTFTVGWTGNPSIREGDYKGVGLIQDAASAAGIPLVIQSFDKRISQAEMPQQFYRRISCYVCASEAEGTPNPVLEAAACGRPAITTRVGITGEVIWPGETGLFVERTSDDLARAMLEVSRWDLEQRAAACRASVEPRHSWDVAAERWGQALAEALS